MGKMRRLLAAVLVASMLFGTNGVSYAAETIADGASQETTVEETTEAVTEDTESAAPAESDPSETVDAVTQTGAEDSSQDDSEAAEEVRTPHRMIPKRRRKLLIRNLTPTTKQRHQITKQMLLRQIRRMTQLFLKQETRVTTQKLLKQEAAQKSQKKSRQK